MTLIGTGDDGKAAAAGGKLIQGKDGSGNAQHVLVDTDGRLDLGTVTVTGAAGGTSSIDDAAFTAASGTGTPIMGFVTADTVDSGDVGVVGMDVNRNLKVSIEADNVGIGGGIQYTEDAAAAANPVGNALIGVRADTLAGVTTTDGDNVAARMTDKGELYVKHADSVAVTSSTFATSAKQDTIIGHVDGIEGLLTTIDGDTGNIATSTATIAGAVSGTEMQVDVLTMPTTTVQATNLDIRDLSAASDSVSIHGDVGVLDQLDLTNSNPAAVAIVDSNGDQITSFGGGTQYTEDAAAAANPVGTALNLIRADSLAGITTTDGDNLAARGTDKGELYVKHVDAIPVTDNGGVLTVDGTVSVTGVSTAANQTTIIGHLDGVEGILTTIDTDTGNIATDVDTVASTVATVSSTPLARVAIFDDNDAQITTFGGGTQYTEGDTDASITGTALMMEGAANTLVAAPGTAADGLLVNLGSNNDVTVSGVSTSAKQDTIIGHLDGVETLLGTIDADTGNIATSVATVAGAVSGTEVQVDVLTMPTTTVQATNLDIRDLTNTDVVTAELSAVDNAVLDTIDAVLDTIKVDTASIVTAVQLIDNAIHVDDAAFTLGTHSGVMMMGFAGTQSVNANDAGAIAMETDGAIHIHDGGNTITVDGTVTANLSGTDNAVLDTIASPVATIGSTPLQRIAIFDNADTQITSFGGGTEYDENAATPATPKGATVMIERDDALSTPVAEGDWMGLKGDANGALYVTLATKLDSTNDSVEAVLSATDNAVLDAIAASVAAIDTDATTIIGHVDGIEGLLTTIDTDTGNIATSLAVMDDWDNAASDGASVSGDVAHDTADAGEPVKVGFKAESSPKGITLVADGDRTDGFADLDGLQMVKLNTSYADIISESVSNTNGSATAFSNFGAVASTKNYVNSITVYNSSATPGHVIFTDGSGGTTKWTMPLPAGSGSVISSAMPLFSTSANTALYFDVSAALSTVYISVSGFQSKL